MDMMEEQVGKTTLQAESRVEEMDFADLEAEKNDIEVLIERDVSGGDDGLGVEGRGRGLLGGED